MMDESKFYAFCLQGDVTSAYEYLRNQPNKSEKELELEAQYFQRFFSGKPQFHFKSNDRWIRDTLSAYYQYFILVLTGFPAMEAEASLVGALKKVLNSSETDLDKLEEKLEVIFKEKGYSFLGGVTPPYRGPYIWKTTEKREFQVELPKGTQVVAVYFLSDFILQGWLHFATFGEKFAGGWAAPEGLYYVAEVPKHKEISIDSNEFQVSYLKHEAQHLSDYTNFPKLSGKDLEYRAKLVELIYEPDSMRLLSKFYYEQKNDPNLPHPYSSHVIMKNLFKLAFGENESFSLEDWRNEDPGNIQNWSRLLYEEHTVRLKKDGPETTGTI